MRPKTTGESPGPRPQGPNWSRGWNIAANLAHPPPRLRSSGAAERKHVWPALRRCADDTAMQHASSTILPIAIQYTVSTRAKKQYCTVGESMNCCRKATPSVAVQFQYWRAYDRPTRIGGNPQTPTGLHMSHTQVGFGSLLVFGAGFCASLDMGVPGGHTTAVTSAAGARPANFVGRSRGSESGSASGFCRQGP